MIEGSGVGQVAEKVCAAGDAPGGRAGEVRGIGEATENHLGGSVYLASVGVGGGVSEEAVQSFHRVGRGRSLLRGQGTGGGQETRVDGAAIVE